MTSRLRIAVVGDGIIGLSAAFALHRSGVNVSVYGANDPGAAWRAAAGMLSPGGEIQGGEPEVITDAQCALEQWSSWSSELTAVGIAHDYQQRGTLLVGPTPADRELIRTFIEVGRALLPSPSEIRRDREPSAFSLVTPRIDSGVLYAEESAVDPQLLVPGLMAWLRDQGLPFYGPAIAVDGGTVATLDTRASYDRVIVATGCVPIPGVATPDTRPVRGTTILLEDCPSVSSPVLRGYVEGRPFYIVPRSDGRIVIGTSSEEEEHEFARAGEIRQILDDIFQIAPTLREARVASIRVGHRPTSATNIPSHQTQSDGLVLRLGNHYRHGVLFAPLAAQAALAFGLA